MTVANKLIKVHSSSANIYKTGEQSSPFPKHKSIGFYQISLKKNVKGQQWFKRLNILLDKAKDT